MALELNGTTGVSLVQDGVVTAADLASTLDLSGKTVTLASGVGGKILQSVTATTTSEVSLTQDQWTPLITTSITPLVSNSTLLFQCEAVRFTQGDGAAEGRVRFQDGTNISVTYRLFNNHSDARAYWNPTFIGSIVGTHTAGDTLTVGVYCTRQSGSTSLVFGDDGSTSRLRVMELAE